MGRIHERVKTVAAPLAVYPTTEINVAAVSGGVGPLLIFELLFRVCSEIPLPAACVDRAGSRLGSRLNVRFRGAAELPSRPRRMSASRPYRRLLSGADEWIWCK